MVLDAVIFFCVIFVMFAAFCLCPIDPLVPTRREPGQERWRVIFNIPRANQPVVASTANETNHQTSEAELESPALSPQVSIQFEPPIDLPPSFESLDLPPSYDECVKNTKIVT